MTAPKRTTVPAARSLTGGRGLPARGRQWRTLGHARRRLKVEHLDRGSGSSRSVAVSRVRFAGLVRVIRTFASPGPDRDTTRQQQRLWPSPLHSPTTTSGRRTAPDAPMHPMGPPGGGPPLRSFRYIPFQGETQRPSMTIMRPNGVPGVLAAETYWSAKRTRPSGRRDDLERIQGRLCRPSSFQRSGWRGCSAHWPASPDSRRARRIEDRGTEGRDGRESVPLRELEPMRWGSAPTVFAVCVVVLLGASSAPRAAKPPNPNDPCARSGRDTCGTAGVGFYRLTRYGTRWFGDFRGAVKGHRHAFCIDLRFWYASPSYRYREVSSTLLRNRDGATISPEKQRRIAYARGPLDGAQSRAGKPPRCSTSIR
jgi:hypothetical protein